MNDCSRIEEHFVDYLDGTLSPGERAAVDTHLATCAACSESIRAYRSIQEAYRSAPADDVGAGIADRILAAARAERSTDAGLRRSSWILAAAAAVLIVTTLAVMLRRGDVAPLVRQGEAHFAAGDHERALEAYERALGLADDSQAAEILHRLGEIHVAQRDFSKALARLTLVSTDHPNYADRRAALLLRGRALEGLGELGQAIEAYRLVEAEFPADRAEVASRILALEERSFETRLEALGYVGD